MHVHVTDPLFAWLRLEDQPQLATLAELVRCLPDGPLLDGLRRARGRGRDDFPVDRLWGVLLFTIALRHTSFESCLAELHRNASLCRLIGIHRVRDIPHLWNLSRFLDVLGEPGHQQELRKVFDVLVQRLGRAVPDLGRNTAGDSTGLNARARKDAQAVRQELDQGLPHPSGGRKEYKDDAGQVTQVVEWFGYKHHLLVDVKHEVPLAYQVTDTKAGDTELIGAPLDQATANLPAQRIRTRASDKAADDEKVHERLHQQGIKPLIRNRAMWQEEPERPIPGPKGRYPLKVLHDEAGTLYCYDQAGDPPVRRQMAYVGYEKDRGTLKYRFPARQEGFPCANDERCNAGKAYGRIVRVPCGIDLRRFPPIPRARRQFERRYKGRTAGERVNARPKIFWGVDDGTITGARRFHAYVGAVMVICVAFATLLAKTPRRAGSMGDTRLSPTALALEGALAAEADQGGSQAPAADAGTSSEGEQPPDTG
jgi:hypothetical protein